MKKIITLLTLLTITFGLFAEGKVKVGAVYNTDMYSIRNDKVITGCYGYCNMISADIDFDIHNKYVGNDLEIVATKNYYDFLDTFNINLWQPNNFTLALESNLEYLWANQHGGRSNIYYADIGLAVKYKANVTSWFTAGADGFFGYVPVAIVDIPSQDAICKDNNTSTKITLWCQLFDIVKIYAGMESIEYWKPGMMSFAPRSVRNTIGISASYDFNNNFGIYSNVDYYCQHPETSWGGEYASQVNRVKFVCKIGAFYAF